jgi:hypothetical protein
MITSAEYAQMLVRLRENRAASKVQTTVTKPTPLPTLDSSPIGKDQSMGRPLVRFRMRRCWILDRDNAWGAIKSLLDGLSKAGLIAGDAEDQIELEVCQEKVSHLYQEGTTIEIDYVD